MTRRLTLLLTSCFFALLVSGPAVRAGEDEEKAKQAELERALAEKVAELERAAAAAKAVEEAEAAKKKAEADKAAADKKAAEKKAADEKAAKEKAKAVPVVRGRVLIGPGGFVPAPAKPVKAADGKEDAGAAAEAEAPAEAVEPQHEVRLKSGTVLVGKLEPVRWKITTAFGELEVPVIDMKLIRFGRKSDPKRIQAIQTAIATLASEHPDERARARAYLKNAGAFAASDLKAAIKSHEDPEVKRNCKELLDAMNLKADQLIPDEDRIETATFPIRGQVGPDSFKVTVDELGAININRSDIVRIRLYKKSRVIRVKITGTNMWPNNWLDTNIKLKKGEKFRITATGTIRFPNWGNRSFSPDGDFRMGNINGIPNGALGARIGPSGRQFKAGKSHTGTADRNGTLQLCLMANMRGHPTNGEYIVSIERLMD